MSMRWEDVYLEDCYPFDPMINEEEFLFVEGNNKRNKYKKHSDGFKPLLWKVVNVDHPQIEYKPQVSKGKNDKYLYYIVSNKDKKSLPEYREAFWAVRAKKIVDAIDKVLKQIEDTYCKKDFEVYLRKAKTFYDAEIEEMRARVRNINRNNTRIDDEIKELTLWMISKKSLSEKQKKLWEERCKTLEEELKKNRAKIKELKKEEQDVLPSFEKFLNTMRSLIESYSTMPWDKKLQIAEVLVLNTYIKDTEVHWIELNEPFNELVNNGNTIWFSIVEKIRKEFMMYSEAV